MAENDTADERHTADDRAATNGQAGPAAGGGRAITDAGEFRSAMDQARRGQVSDIVDVLRRTDLTKLARTRRGVRAADSGDDVLIVRA